MVCPHYRKVKRVDVVYHNIFSLVRRVCAEYPSYVLSQHDAPRPHPNVPALLLESFSAEKKNEEFFSFSSNKEPPVLLLYLISILSSQVTHTGSIHKCTQLVMLTHITRP
jgi:hypothetical protein